ncbi:type II secretion system F family protein [Paenibacillaceae bacterium WGS1546]|uniref:type II secretion system F family protein n=1 Tax=Cohnella sp. WGS1546 TaxID=3366810 RepID=UPI00372CE920
MELGVGTLVAILFVLLFVSARYGLLAWWEGQARKWRLSANKSERKSGERLPRWKRLSRPYRHLSDLLLALGWRMNPSGFAVCSLAMGLAGVAVGIVVFQSFRSVLLLAFMFGCLPYLLLRVSLTNRQMATRLEFLPAVELFYQSYLVTGCRHIRIALQKTVEERRLPGEVQAVFEQLYRHLSVKGDDEGSLRRFSLSFGSMWAEYFGNILKVALEEGNNVSDNLKELIFDMRKAQLSNQVERHKLLEIRLANYTPALFLALFVGVNFRLNPAGSYQYYLVDPGGRGMLLNAVVLLFGSFMMGLYLSRKKL